MDTVPFAEVVFGFVYAAGTNPDAVISVLRNYLKQYGYLAEEFRVSDHLRTLDLDISFNALSEFEKMNALMDAGNEARRRTDSSILAVMAVNDILDRRTLDQYSRPIPRERVAHIIRSLKRPEEVLRLKEIYRPGFFLIAVADDEDSQRAYLTKEMGLLPDESDSIIERDQREREPSGQQTRDTFYLADVFVELKEERFKNQLERFLDLVFAHPFRTPTKHEHAMFMAYASAARSAQLGRQVGAAIATAEGDVLAVGMNEVPCRRGGPYWEGDADDDRDHLKPIDPNVSHKDRIVRSVLTSLKGQLLSQELLKTIIGRVIGELNPGKRPDELDPVAQSVIEKLSGISTDEQKAAASVQESELKEITEYGRAVHGEMDALLTCARLGISVRGKNLYVTTFPCHNCTRHIIAAGISKVYYIEPYAKSKARDLHADAICFDEKEAEKTGKIPFLPFVGIGPRRYLDLFSLELSSGRTIKRKDRNGSPDVPARSSRPPRVPMVALSYLEREDKLITDYHQQISLLQGRKDDNTAQGPHGVEPPQLSPTS